MGCEVGGDERERSDSRSDLLSNWLRGPRSGPTQWVLLRTVPEARGGEPMSAGWTVAECRGCGATLDVGAERDDAPLCAVCAWEAGEDSEAGRPIPDGGQKR